MICLQILYLGKMRSSHIPPQNNAAAIYCTLKCLFCVRKSGFVFEFCVISPSASLTSIILTPWVGSWQKTLYSSHESQQMNRVRVSRFYLTRSKSSMTRDIQMWINKLVTLQYVSWVVICYV